MTLQQLFKYLDPIRLFLYICFNISATNTVKNKSNFFNLNKYEQYLNSNQFNLYMVMEFASLIFFTLLLHIAGYILSPKLYRKTKHLLTNFIFLSINISLRIV